MPSHFFNILVHHSLVPALRGESLETRGMLQKTLERLQLGIWDGGTRVKVLKGIPKLVYEARLNRSLRLLFTVARAFSPRPPHALEHYLLAWDVVDHDHIDRARRMNIEPETGFLDFEEVAAADIDEPPLAPEAHLEVGGEAPGDLLGWLNDHHHVNSSIDELTESIRWFEIDPDIVTDEAEWQAMLDDPSIGDLELKLSREQALTLHQPGPLLLRGTAGSGKTTVSVYRLARAVSQQPYGRHLLVTYSDALLNSARKLFRDLFKARRQPLPDPMPTFATFPQLYQQLAGHHQERRDLLRYPRFEQWYRTLYRRNDAALAWEEIRGIIKGGCLQLDRTHLSLDEYEALGRKRAPLFAGERPRLYQVFGKYTDWCRSQALVDDIDLARQALRQLQHGKLPPYDHVICDEGQDLTELEMRFLVGLVRDLSGLFFAADPQQIVNPSGFRWAELRTLLRDLAPNRGAPEISSLTRNYRSVQSIVGLANAFVRTQRQRTGRTDDDHLQETTLQGASPVLVAGEEQAVIEQLKGFGPRCAIIATSADAVEHLTKHLESERVFDIAGAKGLEFDGCVIWNLLSSDLETWQRLLAGDEDLKEDPEARRALRHAYVAVTRARRYLGVFEASAEALDLWRQPALRAHIERDKPEALAKFMLFATTPQEWAEEGDYFLERGRYRQAAECYRRAGNRRREQLAMAAFQESVGQYQRAADLFVALDELGRAAPCLAQTGRHEAAANAYESVREWQAAGANFEAAGLVRQAADAYQKANATEDYWRCMRRFHELKHDHANAARIAVKQGDVEGAATLYRRAGMKEEALNVQLDQQNLDHGDAAQLLEQAKRFADAAEQYEEAGQPTEASRCRALAAERNGDLEEAATHWHAAGQTLRALKHQATAFEKEQAWEEAAAIYEQLGQQHRLMHCLRRAPGERARHWLNALTVRRDDPWSAAKSYLEIGREEDAKRVAAEIDDVAVKEIELKIKVRRRIEAEPNVPVQTLRKLVGIELGVVVEELTRAERFEEAGRLAQDVELYAVAASNFQQAGDERRFHRCTALHHERRGNWADAADHFEASGNQRDANKMRAMAAEMAGDYHAAAEHYEQARMTAQARRCREAMDEPPPPENGPGPLPPDDSDDGQPRLF